MTQTMLHADLILLGKIYTADPLCPIAEGAAVKDGKFLYVGTARQCELYKGPDTRLLSSEGGLILPGMTDGHAHVTSTTELIFGVNLYEGHTLDYYLHTIQDYVNHNPHETVITGKGYVNGAFDAVGPTAAMLDEIRSDIPIILSAEDCHSVWINSKALELLQIDENTPEIPNGEIVRYPGSLKPTGWLKESARHLSSAISPEYTIEHYKKAILYYQDMALSNGITNCFEPLLDSRMDYALRMDAYEELEQEGKLSMTFRTGYSIEPETDVEALFAEAVALKEHFKDHDKIQLGTIKLYEDGILEGHTAFLKEPYADTPEDCGAPIWSQEDLNKIVQKAHESGFMLHTHAIGDASVEYVLNAYEHAYQAACQSEGDSVEAFASDHRDAITHLQLVNEAEKKRMAALQVVGVVNPYWHFQDPKYYHALEVPYLGEERAFSEYPLHSLLREGVHLSQASDWPVSVPAPTFTSLHLMVNRREPGNAEMIPLNKAECLTVPEALQVLTMEGAWQNKLNDKKGSISVDKDADFVIIDNDVLTMEPQRIYLTRVLSTYVHGQKVWSSI